MPKEKKSRWARGESGNPAGRALHKKPAHWREVVELARTYSTAAVEALNDCLLSPDERVKMTAAEKILDRAFGKPVQAIQITDDGAENIKPIPSSISNLGKANRLLLDRMLDKAKGIQKEHKANGTTDDKPTTQRKAKKVVRIHKR